MCHALGAMGHSFSKGRGNHQIQEIGSLQFRESLGLNRWQGVNFYFL